MTISGYSVVFYLAALCAGVAVGYALGNPQTTWWGGIVQGGAIGLFLGLQLAALR